LRGGTTKQSVSFLQDFIADAGSLMNSMFPIPRAPFAQDMVLSDFIAGQRGTSFDETQPVIRSASPFNRILCHGIQLLSIKGKFYFNKL